MGSLREAARDRDWRGGRVNPSCWPYARARRAATGRAACELWGLCARPPAIEIGEGGLVSLTPGSARYKFRVMNYRDSPPVTPTCCPLRAREALRHGTSRL